MIASTLDHEIGRAVSGVPDRHRAVPEHSRGVCPLMPSSALMGVGCQRIRRELPIPKMIQEPADRPHRLAVITDQPYPADDAAIPLLDDPHPRLLASCRQQHRQRMRRRMTNGKKSRKIPQQVVQIRTCSAGTPSPRCPAPGSARCAIRMRPTARADAGQRLRRSGSLAAIRAATASCLGLTYRCRVASRL